jgi:hypothetical protein
MAALVTLLLVGLPLVSPCSSTAQTDVLDPKYVSDYPAGKYAADIETCCNTCNLVATCKAAVYDSVVPVGAANCFLLISWRGTAAHASRVLLQLDKTDSVNRYILIGVAALVLGAACCGFYHCCCKSAPTPPADSYRIQVSTG